MKIKEKEEFIFEIEERFPNQVTFEKTVYKGAFSECIVTCPTHGDIKIIPHNVLRKNRLGVCIKCTSERLKNDEKTKIDREKNFIERLYKRFPDFKYDLSKIKYIDAKTHIDVICHEKDKNGEEHGVWKIRPANLYYGFGCPKCANLQVGLRNRIPYEKYCELIKEKYGDIYEVDKESYENINDEIKIFCKKHNDYFIVKSREFPRYNNHKCHKCFEEELNFININCDDVIQQPENEVWVDVLGFEGQYQCSSEGRFKNINVKNRCGGKAADRIIHVNFTNRLGSVFLNGKCYFAHRKIYESFHKVKLKSGYEQTIDHIDNDVKNNRISNLRLGGSIKENMVNNKKTHAKLSARGGSVGIKPIFDFENLDGEKWVDAIGYEKFYSVSNFGRVMAKERTVKEKNGKIRIKRKHLMRQCIKYGQYYTLGLIGENSEHKTHYTHKLVYESFNGRIKNGNQVDHIDSNPLNNKLENLREVTPLENIRNINSQNKRKKPRTHIGVKIKKVDLQGNVIEEYASIKEASVKNGIKASTLNRYFTGKIDQRKNRMKGYYFEREM